MYLGQVLFIFWPLLFYLSAVETIIYLMDKTGIHFNVDDGQKAEAGELFEYVMEELQLPAEAREVFSLWLVSDLLGE